ncbi:formate dehydrogenase [Mycobacterium sp. 852013-50091_SCH5140682]|uniref:formate dehydrogenase subunit delta n=1 Tax=Mycobacterium sp. 852013-50091_SCH5140682 TaxID=1834109 RepID=UPI0007E92A49|nr:formate dehydrogenase subunit delta [Mycobacterium sp. 852013-50091_SCH5140682]OBC04577.1 formate dehydrogenase [Mycobacterium sp. 852013-50091_SCH5140682]
MARNAPAEIRMINSIAAHFGHLHAEQAAAAVADHIGRFWDPRMKHQLQLLVAMDTGALDPVALAATVLLR